MAIFLCVYDNPSSFDQQSIAKVQQIAAFDFKGFIQISGKANKENEVFSVEVAVMAMCNLVLSGN
ncbi:hypothetical protein QFZ77_000139 [Paenibacillus sp. V4I3]|uniref:hypothetical protein n=1 Tax=Paenibacillus sp. V4I3 TaxID=3042305 RepID=UPI00278998BB|nr:hypothetical protein [Paenibacillus sp. V4I3]MDQ0871480.1 hypothetical protein [Paenibacillus sp. V4I3]